VAVGDCDAAVWDSASVRDGLRGYYRHKHSLALHWNNKAAVDGVGGKCTLIPLAFYNPKLRLKNLIVLLTNHKSTYRKNTPFTPFNNPHSINTN